MGKAVILVLVTIGIGLLVYWLAGSRTPAPAKAPSQIVPHGTTNTARPANVEPYGGPIADISPSPGPIAPPRTSQQKESDATEARRAEFYARIRHDAGNAFVEVRPSEEDAATLDIKATQDNPADILPLLNVAFRNNAYYYGFRHVRFYAPNPPQIVERYRLAAEATADSQGNWQTFQK